jgi:NADPH:quinone reductase-like Zn-dependent oxidoreductase
MTAQALWCTAPNRAEIRPAEMGRGVAIETLYSGISRGTERLVSRGEVPVSEHQRMRGAGMEGIFPFPVKYGYCNVGRVIEGPLEGRCVFALFPHQTLYRLPHASLTLLPEALPPERAILGANMETALNILWDSGAGAGDKIAVIGAGVVGALVAKLAAAMPGAEVTLVDTNSARRELASALDLESAAPRDSPRDCDVVIHSSASEAGLELALSIAGQGATIVEASWFGDRSVNVTLGGPFHSRRLRLISSQVGDLPADRLPRWTYNRRMAKALDLLCDPVLNVLISGESFFYDLPNSYADILAAPETLCHRICYKR